MPPPCELRHAPNDGDEKADMREVRVAIGPGACANLDDAEEWHKGAEEPQKTDEEVGIRAPSHSSGDRQSAYDQRGEHCLPHGRGWGLRVDRQTGGPDGPPEVCHIRDRCSGDAL